uniref:Uncharacterized protein n=1 Tax=Strongyloides papillosus TaxID=174720 RepID=A0A0N5C6B8_STREA
MSSSKNGNSNALNVQLDASKKLRNSKPTLPYLIKPKVKLIVSLMFVKVCLLYFCERKQICLYYDKKNIQNEVDLNNSKRIVFDTEQFLSLPGQDDMSKKSGDIVSDASESHLSSSNKKTVKDYAKTPVTLTSDNDGCGEFTEVPLKSKDKKKEPRKLLSEPNLDKLLARTKKYRSACLNFFRDPNNSKRVVYGKSENKMSPVKIINNRFEVET